MCGGRYDLRPCGLPLGWEGWGRGRYDLCPLVMAAGGGWRYGYVMMCVSLDVEYGLSFGVERAPDGG